MDIVLFYLQEQKRHLITSLLAIYIKTETSSFSIHAITLICVKVSTTILKGKISKLYIHYVSSVIDLKQIDICMETFITGLLILTYL